MSSKKINKVNIPKVSEIKNPDFLADLSYEELDILSSNIRDEIIDITSKNGGHLSSNLGVVEATIALHRVFDFKKDKIIFDVGHQSYTHKILTGRNLSSLRKKDGISGFQKISESEYDPFDAGHSSTSISAASGFAYARDLANEDYEVIAFIGDGAIASGLAFEALNNLAHQNNKVIIVLNDNEMSISRPVGGLGKSFAKISISPSYNSFKRKMGRLNRTKFGKKLYIFFRKAKNYIKLKLVPQTFFDSLGLSFIGPIDGHNIKAMEKAFKKAKSISKSVVIDICTNKGKGYKYAEEDETGFYHGVSKFNIKTGEMINNHVGYISWSNLMSQIVYKNMKNNDKIILISPATIKGSELEDIFHDFPSRSIDVGISEEHAMTFASALSLSSFHPVIDIYSTFLQRAYDEVSHDLARLNSSATVLVDRAGLVGSDGETHQGIYDVSMFINIPNTIITMPSNIHEANALFNLSLKFDKPFFIRFPRDYLLNEDIKEENLEFGKWKTLIKTSDEIAIISMGPIINEIRDLIIKNNIKVSLYNALFLNNLDESIYIVMKQYKKIIIHDAYSTVNGFIDYFTANLAIRGYKGEIIPMGIDNVFVKQASIKEQLKEFGLLANDVIKKI